MSDFLTIDGTAVPMVSFSWAEPHRVGQAFRCYDGTMASQVRAEKRRGRGSTGFLNPTQDAALSAACALDVAVPVVLTLVVDGVTTTTTLDAAQVRMTRDVNIIGYWSVTLEIEEV